MILSQVKMANWWQNNVLSFLVFYSLICCCFCGFSKDVTCATDAYPPDARNRIPEFVINLDLPPEQRWTHVLVTHASHVRELLTIFKDFLRGLGSIGGKLLYAIDTYAPKILSSLPEEYALEMKGISNVTGLPIGEVVMFNVFYEFFTVCTSIIARDPNGTLHHVRNMDFGLFMGWNNTAHTWSVSNGLRPLIINLRFERQSKTIFKATSFAGFIGVLTAVKPHNFTFTINERFALNGGWLGLIEYFLGDHTQQWLSVTTRQLMEKVDSFDGAMKLLSTTPLIAPAYFIVGGLKPNEGCVISRARKEVLNTRCLNDTQWFVLETNYDYWKPPFFLDDRRTSALHCLNQMTSHNVNLPSLYNVLDTQPNLNKLTVYTALMRVDDGHLEAWRQDCKDPCSPW